jgi:hypothetical protein
MPNKRKRRRRFPQPKTHNLPSRPASLLRRWRRAMVSIRERATDLWERRDIYKRWAKTVIENPALDKGNEFFAFINDAYLTYFCVGVRLFDDHDKKSYSLLVLIEEILQAHTVFTRVSYVRQSRCKRFAEEEFTKNWGTGATIARKRIEADRRELVAACRKVRLLTNKNLAHNSRRKRFAAPTYGEADAALDTIYRLISRYHVLLFKSSWGPPVSLHWAHIFDVRWSVPSPFEEAGQ